MKILVDSAMPNALEVFSPYGEVVLKPGRDIVREDLKDIDALMIRSVTKVDEKLLAGASKLKFVGTATAGCDHVDEGLLKQLKIGFASAPGANKESVGDYILSVLLVFAQRYDLKLDGMSIGVVGCGNTGSEVIKKAEALNMRVVKRDPPLFDTGQKEYGASLEDCLSCDFTTFHVPLIEDGKYKTYHLIDETALQTKIGKGFLINASRGAVLDNKALLALFEKGEKLRVWLDVFEGEPDISYKKLIPFLEGSTAHIAGYSYESKRRAAYMLAVSMCKYLNIPLKSSFIVPPPEFSELDIGRIDTLDRDLISRLVFSIYDVRRDSFLFKNRCIDGKSFDALRKNYRERRELSSLTLCNVPIEYRETLKGLGFSLNDD